MERLVLNKTPRIGPSNQWKWKRYDDDVVCTSSYLQRFKDVWRLSYHPSEKWHICPCG